MISLPAKTIAVARSGDNQRFITKTGWIGLVRVEVHCCSNNICLYVMTTTYLMHTNIVCTGLHKSKHTLHPGDFHFLWECLRVAFTILWGTPTLPGSLCNLRESSRCLQVDKSVKVFNVGDEFIVHAFKAHLTAAVMRELNINVKVTDHIQHQTTQQSLQQTAEKHSEDPVYLLHRTFLHLGYLYIDLREASKWESGPQIICHWKLWLPRFLATKCKNYASELLSNLTATFPKHIAYIITHNQTVNTTGKPGHGKPIDQLMEHYNL